MVAIMTNVINSLKMCDRHFFSLSKWKIYDDDTTVQLPNEIAYSLFFHELF